MKIKKTGLPILLAMIMLVGCGTKKEADSQMKIAYISKDLSHYWYQQVQSGLESKCEEKGMVLQCFDAAFDDDTCMKLVKQVIEEQYNGLIISTTNQNLGPEISAVCEKAEIPVIAIDDSMQNESGKSFPCVSMATREVGAIGGGALAKLAKEREFPLDSGKVHILELDVPELTVFRERLTGYEEALFGNTKLTRDSVVTIDVKNGMYEDNYDAVMDYFQTQPPEADSFWIICGCNDDCALAPMHALLELGIPQEQILSCGLGGYELSVQEFEKENENYITVMTQPDVEGSKAAEMMYAYLADGQPMDDSIILGGSVTTCDNYLVYFNDRTGLE